MPCLTVAPLFASDGLLLKRVACDGIDTPRPVDEALDAPCVIVVLQGRFTFRDAAGRAVASPAAGLCLPGDHAFCVRHVDEEGDLCVSMRGDLSRALVEAGPIVRRISADGYVRMRAVAAALARGTPLARLAIEEAWCEALSPAGPSPVGPSRVGSSPIGPSPVGPSPRSVSASARAIADAIAYALERNVGDRVALSSLARTAGVSVFHACRVFKDVTGVGMHRYHEEIRLRHALAWLLDSDRPIAQIAADLGFAHQAHFTTLFRRRFHTTPAHARRTGRLARLDAR